MKRDSFCAYKCKPHQYYYLLQYIKVLHTLLVQQYVRRSSSLCCRTLLSGVKQQRHSTTLCVLLSISWVLHTVMNERMGNEQPYLQYMVAFIKNPLTTKKLVQIESATKRTHLHSNGLLNRSIVRTCQFLISILTNACWAYELWQEL